MDETKRPVGLIAMAVVNFLFGVIAILGVLAVYGFTKADLFGDGADRSFRESAGTTTYVVLATGALIAVLLLASGAGYLARKKFLGRFLGNAYGVVSIVTVVAIVGVKGTLPDIVALFALVFTAYPIATLVLINSRYKRSLTR
jgi:hypothetical protein